MNPTKNSLRDKEGATIPPEADSLIRLIAEWIAEEKLKEVQSEFNAESNRCAQAVPN